MLFILTACETASQDEQVIVYPSAIPEVEMPPPQPTYGRLPNYDNQIPSAINGSVTVYSLDGAPPATAPTRHIGMMPAPLMMTNNGSVTTYGLTSNMSPSNYAPMNYSGQVDEQIFFKNGSSRLGSIDKQKISSFAEKAKFAPIDKITVEGYASRPTQAGTDTVDAYVLNLKESMNRSLAVSKTLMRDGVPAEKIKTMSHGSIKATGDDNYDRRVDMIMGER